jgi:hypothetical protein
VKDIVLVAIVVLGFAWVVTAHVAITFGLLQKKPRWRALVGFAIAPLAPYWAWREQMRKRVWLWLAGVAVYAVALVLASF